jgi:hypothetical protein|tara:strand:+ start:361 stop:552 length:192 start_codon:yes stop_codon:yes gene_type:complete
MNLSDLKKEADRLIEIEEQLLTFLIYYPESAHEATVKIIEVCSLIVRTQNLIKERNKDCDSDD